MTIYTGTKADGSDMEEAQGAYLSPDGNEWSNMPYPPSYLGSSYAEYLAMMALISSGPGSRVQYGEEFRPIPKHIPEETRNALKLNKGMGLFDIDGVKVWALNRKNAVRKAKRVKDGSGTK